MTATPLNLYRAHPPLKQVEVIFYTHQDCHLCDDMGGKLNEFIVSLNGQIEINVIMRDIEDHTHWYKRYHEYVPVLVVNDEEVCHYFLDRDELTNAIVQATGTHLTSTVHTNNSLIYKGT